MSASPRRRFVLAATLLAVTGLARGQTAERVRRVGWLTAGSPVSHARALASFREGLKEHGWVEGHNVALELRWAEGRMERLPDLAAETVKSKPEVIVTAANVVALALHKATTTIPIVMATGSDPVAAGLAKSLARPGGNVTGLTGFYESTPAKMLELVAGIVPRGARVAVLMDNTSGYAMLGESVSRRLEQDAVAAGLRLAWIAADTTDALLQGIAELGKDRPAAMIILPSAQVFANAPRFVEQARPLRIPVVYPFEEMAEAGGLIAYAPDLQESYRRAARYVDRILKGAKPGELPIEQPTRLALTINARTAKAQGIALPAGLLARADRIVE
jgi:putative ABC transport system substrate-binding protein